MHPCPDKFSCHHCPPPAPTLNNLAGARIWGRIQGVLWQMWQPAGPRVPKGRPWWGRIKVIFPHNMFSSETNTRYLWDHFHSTPSNSFLMFQVLNIQPFFEVCPQGTEVEAVEAENLHFCTKIFHRRWSSCLKLRGLLLMFVEKRTDFLCDWLRC